MRWGKIAITACAALLMGACATASVPAPMPGDVQTAAIPAVQADVAKVQGDLADALTKLAKAEVADLTAAKADADAHNDLVASQCYAGLLPIVQALQSSTPGSVLPTLPKGPASLFQAVRDTQQGGVGGTPTVVKQIEASCGGLAISARIDVLKLIVQIAGASAGAGPAAGVGGAVIQGIPTILGPALKPLQ